MLVLDRHSEELLNVSGQVELVFMSWLDVSEEDASQSVDRDCAGKNSKRWDPTAPGTVASMRSLEYVMFSFHQSDDVDTWSGWVVGTNDHVFGRIKRSLLGRCHESDCN